MFEICGWTDYPVKHGSGLMAIQVVGYDNNKYVDIEYDVDGLVVHDNIKLGYVFKKKPTLQELREWNVKLFTPREIKIRLWFYNLFR